MDHAIRRVFDVVLSTTRPQVTISVPVALEVAIYGRCQCEAPDVELAIFVQERPLNVFLDNVATFVPLHVLCLD